MFGQWSLPEAKRNLSVNLPVSTEGSTTARGLSLACLGFEEGVEISDEILRPASCPWNEWLLVIAAIKELPSENKLAERR
jgi:hypothetical protein